MFINPSKYGIYLAFPPHSRLNAEGIGRHLMYLLEAAQRRSDIEFIIACPSWMHENLHELFKDFNFDQKIEIIAPSSQPFLLTIYNIFTRIFKQNKIRRRLISFYFSKIIKVGSDLLRYFQKKITSVRSWPVGFLFLLLLFPFILIFVITDFFRSVIAKIAKFKVVSQKALKILKKVGQKYSKSSSEEPSSDIFRKTLTHKRSFLNTIITERMYRYMLDSDTSLMLKIINGRSDIKAWYCPAAFWPSFNRIKKPKLLCVPDVVLTNFPVGFSLIGNKYLNNFYEIEAAIYQGNYFVTYSHDVKHQTLIQQYGILPDKILVIHHGINRMDTLVKISGTQDDIQATYAFCKQVFQQILKKIPYPESTPPIDASIKFIFYASQFRANKNVFTLVKAYNYLLKNHYISHKLILTGNLEADIELARELKQLLIRENLTEDVLCIHHLSAQQLASCYYLADLAVNPSFSEGGFPFTFSEALSVNTPIIMAEIPVTQEIIKDWDLTKMMLFDPHDWRDLARCMQQALGNLSNLLLKQQPLYQKLAERTWDVVVNEYIQALENISSNEEL